MITGSKQVMSPELQLEQQLIAERNLSSRRERLVEGENEVLRLIIEHAPLSAILNQLVRAAEHQSSPGLLASILLLDEDGLHLRHGAAPSLPDAYNRAIDGIEIGPAVGSCGTAAYTGEPVVVSDIASDPLWEAFKDLAASHGLRACWSTPIISSRGQVLGTFALYYRKPTIPDEQDRLIVQLLTRTCALAIEQSAADRRLEETQERLRCVSRCSPIGIFTTDIQGALTSVNPRFQELGAYDFEKTVEYWLEHVVVEESRAAVIANWNTTTAARADFQADMPAVVAGANRVLRLRAAPMNTSSGSHIGYVGTLEDITHDFDR